MRDREREWGIRGGSGIKEFKVNGRREPHRIGDNIQKIWCRNEDLYDIRQVLYHKELSQGVPLDAKIGSVEMEDDGLPDKGKGEEEGRVKVN